eukprot:COSAG01_NODE_12566_length_1718_cov_3.686226_1_plen_301_part_00
MSLESLGRSTMWAQDGYGYISLAQGEMARQHLFNATRGASSAVLLRPQRVSRQARRHRGGGSSGAGPSSWRCSRVGLIEAALPQHARASAANRRHSTHPGPPFALATAGSDGSPPHERPVTATTSNSGDLSVSTGSAGQASSAWFGSRPSTRGSERRDRAKSVSPYPRRPDPWEPYRARRRYLQAAEAERAAAAWGDSELQLWLAQKEASKKLGVGTWAGELLRFSQVRASGKDLTVPMAPLQCWDQRRTSAIARRELGLDIARTAAVESEASVAQLPALAEAREVARHAYQSELSLSRQ